jgi:hypothetical protein
MGTHSTHIAEADTRDLANEAESANEMAAVAPRVMGV